jgi:uncharacterized DUF497 family protein
MRFSWDPHKSSANLCERGFDYRFASLVFDGMTVEAEDRRQDYGEKRIVAIGVADGVYVTVVYTDRTEDGRVTRRIVSARRSNRRERQVHRKAAEESAGSA